MSSLVFRLMAASYLLIHAAGAARAAAPPDLPPFDPDKPISQADHDRRLAAVTTGLTPDPVRLLIGAPQQICRQILYHRCVEQWIYDGAFKLRLQFDCPRGQEPRLQSVQPPGAPEG